MTVTLMLSALAAVTSAAVTSAAVASATAGPPPAEPPAVIAHARKLGLASHRWAAFDLNGDGRPEQLIYATDPHWCGSGGCTLFVLTPSGGGLKQAGHITLANTPVTVLASTTRGWHDLAIRVSGGGAAPGMARITWRGQRYAGNPSTAPRLLGRPHIIATLFDQANALQDATHP